MRRHPGDVFGRLTVLQRLSVSPAKNPIYLCKCACGTLLNVPGSALSAKGPKSTRSCGCAQREAASRPKGQAGNKLLFRRYVKNAEFRDIDFSLTLDQFKNIISKDCYYCGKAPIPYNPYLRADGSILQNRTQSSVDRAWINVNGVDRLDNRLGYDTNNCVPACSICNYLKLDYTVAEFLGHVLRIADFQSRKGETDGTETNHHSDSGAA